MGAVSRRARRRAELDALADRVLAAGEVVALREGAARRRGVIEPRYEAPVSCSRARPGCSSAPGWVSGCAWHACGRGRSRVSSTAIQLSVEQRRLVRALCGRGAGVAVVRAAAGTGKTFALDAAREAWQADGVEVVGCALSARAALELQDGAGIPSVTIAAVRRHLDGGGGLPRGGVLVVDEAGMVGTRDLAALAAATADARAKLVLVGDDRQLPRSTPAAPSAPSSTSSP